MTRTALLIIDVQNGMFKRGSSVCNDAKLLYNLKKVTASAKSEGMPIFYIQHETKGKQLNRNSIEWQIHPFFKVEKEDEVIYKTTPDSFHQTNLEQKLRDRQIQHLVISGIQTEVCVDTTCRSAFSKGFSIDLILDAHSTWNSPDLSAHKIIQHHNRTLGWFTNLLSTDGFVERLK
ncbi:cysteine hydrolase family protein [Alkalihalobacillus macyae]|uniref:cysteine hydrolase family protein n=1 Tax=Guptibacillus hwajinpoensis TaxID=208199 RepID=UPI00273C0BB6|nr:cysteine hydrolase family protein [Alkalihalobacillus macyae]MDP4549323.1 cysteine hydrolase family protein [Alkalihalobacillus macyae]